ncbi:MAG TPA: hypothetical protein VMF11_02685 [Candidatus Baltobacteraceae bacterium]|nr:hypothetical protein [Candidatus Baltobacteraceae bacterium]
MKRSFLSAIALGTALVAAPICAFAVTNNPPNQLAVPGEVCGRVDAPAKQIVALELKPAIPENIIVARSATEVVTTSVAPDGNFCFAHLAPNLHTLTAFGDSPAEYQAQVTPIPGQSKFIEVTRAAGL